jgi:chemotaxis protein CheX
LQNAPGAQTDDTPENGAALLLPAILDLKAAAPLAAAFLARRGTDIVVDAAAVQRLGGQCLTVLLSAQASWAEDARTLTFENPSPEFCAAIELFGASPALFPHPKDPA